MWLIPSRISNYFLESQGLDWDLKSQSLALSVSLTASGKERPAKYWLRELKKDPSTLLRYLQTFDPSQAELIVGAWRELLGGVPARTSRSQVSGLASEERKVDSSITTCESSKSATPTGSSSRMSEGWCQAELFSIAPKLSSTSNRFSVPRRSRKRLANDGTLSVATSGYTGVFSTNTESVHCSISAAAWKRSVIALRQDCLQRQKSAQATRGSAYLSSPGSREPLWLTSRAEDSESCGNHPGVVDSLWTTPQAHDVSTGNPDRVRRYGTKHGAANLTDDVTAWMTPQTPTGGRSVSAEVVASKGSTADGKLQVPLESMAPLWPTPNTPSGGPNTKSTPTHTGGKVMNWPTPDAGNRGGSQTPEKRKAGGHNVCLQDMGEHWGTPTSRDWKDGSSADTAPTNGLLGRQVIQNWPTPDANAMNDGESRESWQTRADRLKARHINGNGAGMPLAIACQSSHPDPQIPDGPQLSPNSRTSLPPSQRKKLNVCFTSWLMGFPHHWLAPEPMASGPAEMQLWLHAQRWHLLRLLEERS